MRIKLTPTNSMPAALALARQLRITPREALLLLGQPKPLPAEFDATTAETLCTTLRTHGLEATPVEIPPTARRCTTHPTLTGDSTCEDCRENVCPLCLPVCRTCSASRTSASRWKSLRVTVLLLVLVSLGAWGFLRQRKLDQRNAWQRPLRVSVVLVSASPVDERVTTAWSDGLLTLNDWFDSEARRLGLRLEQPLRFELAPTTVLEEAPQPPPGSGKWLEDSQAAVSLRSKLASLADRGQAPGLFDVHLVVALRPAVEGAHLVEGLGEAGGSIGLVEGTAGDLALTLELVAVAHELLHCLGANDAYDEQGHALPRGIVEPQSGLPQRYAEVMVGEVPLGPGEGRIPKSLEEVRIGELTAREIGWSP